MQRDAKCQASCAHDAFSNRGVVSRWRPRSGAGSNAPCRLAELFSSQRQTIVAGFWLCFVRFRANRQYLLEQISSEDDLRVSLTRGLLRAAKNHWRVAPPTSAARPGLRRGFQAEG